MNYLYYGLTAAIIHSMEVEVHLLTLLIDLSLQTNSDFDAKPMVMLLGQYSTGKTTFIKHLLRCNYPGRLSSFISFLSFSILKSLSV